MRLTRKPTSRTCPICGYSLEGDIEKDLASDAGSRSAAYSEAIVTHIQTVHPDFWSWEQSKRRLGFGLGIITGSLTGVGLFFLLAFILNVQGGNWGRLVATLSLGGFLIPYALITRRGEAHFRTQWHEQGKTATPTPTTLVEQTGIETRQAADDYSIVNLVTGLSQLGIQDLRISNVAWKSLIPQGRGFIRVPVDGAVFQNQTMYLATRMEGKLSESDWKPLIASAMINYRKLRPQKKRLLLAMAMPVIITYIASWIFLPPLFPTTNSCVNGQCAFQNWGMFILIFGGIALFVAMIIIGTFMMQKFRVLSDLETVHFFGKSSLTNSLQKVIQASPGDKLSVQKRIDKIERMKD